MTEKNQTVFLDEGVQRTLSTCGVCFAISTMSIFNVICALLFGIVAMWLIWRKEGDSLISSIRQLFDKKPEAQ